MAAPALTRFVLLVFSSTIYYAMTLAVRCWERGGLWNALRHDMVLMDIITQAVVTCAFVATIYSFYYWPGPLEGDRCKQCGVADLVGVWVMGAGTLSTETARLWQDTRDLLGLAVILQWLRFIEYGSYRHWHCWVHAMLTSLACMPLS